MKISDALVLITYSLVFHASLLADDDNGFSKLFDGKSFTGWEGDTVKSFRVEGGAIVAGSLIKRVPRNEFLCSKQQYKNFILKVKFKLEGNEANAGIQFHSKRIPDHHEVIGYQADLGQQYWGALYDESRRRKVLAGPTQEKVMKVLKKNDWNQYTIKAVNGHIQLWINDTKTVDYQEPDPSIPQQGLICLQIHGGPPSRASYKDIRIKEIED